MNVALIAMPSERTPVVPPLTFAYVATVLEQQRHIVRIYDLALATDEPLATSFRPLRAFNPQVVVVAGESVAQLEEALDVLHEQHGCVIPIRLSRESLGAGYTYVDVLGWIEQHDTSAQPVLRGQNELRLCTDADLDQLPFPARHLLSLESYGLRAVGGELQTTLLIGVPACDEAPTVLLRAPSQIVAELRSVSREYGIRHYLLTGAPLTADPKWLDELLDRLCDADCGVGWDAAASIDVLREDLVAQMARAGCETLCLQFNVAGVFESTRARDKLREVVNYARQQRIFVRANLDLEPPYEAIPYLVDVAATFGLDDVSFNVRSTPPTDQMVMPTADDVRLETMARQLYHAGRDRQRLIERYGPTLGPLLWKVRNSRLFAGVLRPGSIGEQEDLAGPA